eukprot:GILI01005210.1.p1 GENE.GILI01005210.1~~GILI01005210.1.p1  ORF type:complete len:531 (-),score=153.42 GILI01005210.1:273-1865(-)
MPPKRAASPKQAAAKKAPSPSPKRATTPKRASTPRASAVPESPKLVAASPPKRVANELTVGKIDAKLNESIKKFTPERDIWDGQYEFGGSFGAIGGTLSALGIMVFSHFIIYYFWTCIEFYNGELVYPGHAALGNTSMVEVAKTSLAAARPTPFTFGVFLAFQLLQYVLAVVMPGPVTYGLRVPSMNGYHYPYRCNAVYAWYVILAVLGTLHFSEIFPLYLIRQDFGRYMSCAVIFADAVAILIFLSGYANGTKMRMSGNLIYDFFMGSVLNPRLPGGVDVKMFAEIRNSWVLLFILTLSCAAEQYRVDGSVSINMWFMILAHFLYVNSCQKGEECIVTTWDIYFEKFGWMLIFWNLAGVPFVYCFQSLFIQTVTPLGTYPWYVWAFLFPFLVTCYAIFDIINAQKNRFRMMRQGVDMKIIRRKTFPQMPWSFIENPRTLVSEDGKLELFADGFYRYARKLHYTVDMCMSLMWGLSCAACNFIPFFYFFFFFSHLTHRQKRDDERCHKKYGKLWEKYTALVPYKFIPYVY